MDEGDQVANGNKNPCVKVLGSNSCIIGTMVTAWVPDASSLSPHATPGEDMRLQKSRMQKLRDAELEYAISILAYMPWQVCFWRTRIHAMAGRHDDGSTAPTHPTLAVMQGPHVSIPRTRQGGCSAGGTHRRAVMDRPPLAHIARSLLYSPM